MCGYRDRFIRTRLEVRRLTCLLGNVEDQHVIFQVNALICDSLEFKEPIIFSFMNSMIISVQALIAAQRVMVCTKNVNNM